MPVRQCVQSVLLDQKRISRQLVLCRVRCHCTLKNRYGSEKMFILSRDMKNIVKDSTIFKIIVWETGVWLKTGNAKKRVCILKNDYK